MILFPDDLWRENADALPADDYQFDKLQSPDEIEGAPALEAIEHGIGRYLEKIGFVREHPCLYVREIGDPFVYVHFVISPDGKGFFERTHVFSPSCAEGLGQIFHDYGLLQPEESSGPVLPSITLFGRPMHACTEALKTFRLEDCLEASDSAEHKATRRKSAGDALRRARQKRRGCIGTIARRRSASRAGRRLIRFALPRDYRNRPDEHFMTERFRSLPLDWRWNASEEFFEHSHWRTEYGTEAAANSSTDVWRAFTEPRLVHSTLETGRDIRLQTRLSNNSGHGVLGIEWAAHDNLFWRLKMQYTTEFFDEEREITHSMSRFQNLYYDLENLRSETMHKIRLLISDKLNKDANINPINGDILYNTLQDRYVIQILLQYQKECAIYYYRETNDFYGPTTSESRVDVLSTYDYETPENIVFEALFENAPSLTDVQTLKALSPLRNHPTRTALSSVRED